MIFPGHDCGHDPVLLLPLKLVDGSLGQNCHLVVWPSLGKDSSWSGPSAASFAVAEIGIDLFRHYHNDDVKMNIFQMSSIYLDDGGRYVHLQGDHL